MQTLQTWGGQLQITTLLQLYQRPVEPYTQRIVPRKTFNNSVNYGNNFAPIRLTFKNWNHYNSVVSKNHGDTVLNIEGGKFENVVLESLSY